jgi:hypothetical protein
MPRFLDKLVLQLFTIGMVAYTPLIAAGCMLPFPYVPNQHATQPVLLRPHLLCFAGTGVDGGVSGPASWQYYHPLNAKVWQKMQPALPRETRETHGGTARHLAGGWAFTARGAIAPKNALSASGSQLQLV